VALVAASVFVAVLAGTYADRKEHLFRLARLAPYPYVASELRGDEPSADFDHAMELYKAGQYRDAAVLLDSCAREEPGDPDVHFYLGVARLLENRPRDAALSLQTAVRLAPASSVYRWHLVQALLCTGDRRTVLRELNILAAGIDEYAAQARQLRARIYSGN
jgi:predicted Zn-dependent protease